MSVVTNIILVTTIEDGAKRDDEYPNVDALNSFFKKDYGNISLLKVDEYAGGSKAMECDVFMAVINHLDLQEFMEHFNKIKGDEPNSVQLFIKQEDDYAFELYTPKANI